MGDLIFTSLKVLTFRGKCTFYNNNNETTETEKDIGIVS